MRILSTSAWVLFAVDALLVGGLFVVRNLGDDAAGRGMATGFAVVLTPVLLAVGALLWWAGRAGSRLGLAAAIVVLGTPLWFVLADIAGELSGGLSRALRDARALRFPDPATAAVAKAVDARRPDRVRELLTGTGIDFAARNPEGVTVLGLAVQRVIGVFPAPEDLESARLLLAAGAPAAPDVLGPETVLLEQVVGGNTPGARELLRLLLDAGADPDVLDAHDRRPLILSTYVDLPELEILAAAGADLDVRDVRPDRPGWNALMNAAFMRSIDQALFLLEHGVSPDHVGDDGATLDGILDEVERSAYRPEPGLAELRAAVARRRAGPETPADPPGADGGPLTPAATTSGPRHPRPDGA